MTVSGRKLSAGSWPSVVTRTVPEPAGRPPLPAEGTRT